MTNATTATARFDPHKIQQAIKWTVYALLIVNFVFYIFEDLDRALHTLDANSTFLDWTSEFATSIDESAWFLLLFMFELETYVISDRSFTRWVSRTVHGIRLSCYALLAHTIVAFVVAVINMQPTVLVEDVSNLCQMTDADVSFVYNLDYTKVNSETCDGLSDATQYFWVADDPIVTSLEGLDLERILAWTDLVEAVAWLLILLAIEIVVRHQSRGVTSGAVISTSSTIKTGLYLLLIALAVYWASLSHWLYFWDELLWIGGFAAIEMNISEWRSEIREDTGV